MGNYIDSLYRPANPAASDNVEEDATSSSAPSFLRQPHHVAGGGRRRNHPPVDQQEMQIKVRKMSGRLGHGDDVEPTVCCVHMGYAVVGFNLLLAAVHAAGVAYTVSDVGVAMDDDMTKAGYPGLMVAILVFDGVSVLVALISIYGALGRRPTFLLSASGAHFFVMCAQVVLMILYADGESALLRRGGGARRDVAHRWKKFVGLVDIIVEPILYALLLVTSVRYWQFMTGNFCKAPPPPGSGYARQQHLQDREQQQGASPAAVSTPPPAEAGEGGAEEQDSGTDLTGSTPMIPTASPTRTPPVHKRSPGHKRGRKKRGVLVVVPD